MKPLTSTVPRGVPSRAAALAGRALALAGILLGAVAALSARAGTLDAAQIREFAFPSGLRLIVKESHATNLAAVQVWIRAGGFLEDEKTSGTAHVIEHLLFKGEETGGPGSIDDEIENLGGLLEASTEKDWTRLSCTISSRYAAKVIHAVGAALLKPQFRAQDLEAEKPVMLEEIAEAQLSPQPLVTSELYDMAFKSHPYKRDVRGTPSFLSEVSIDQVRSYYNRYYRPSAMTVVVVGDVDPAGVERATRSAFLADQPATGAPLKLPPDETACATSDRRVIQRPFTGGYLGLAFPAPSVKQEPDTYAMDVLLTLLDNEGTGRLRRALKGTVGLECSYETRQQPGLFTIVAAAPPGELEHVEAVIRTELEYTATHPIPADEVRTAKQILHGSYASDNEPYAGQASSLGYYASIDRWQFAASYLAQVDAVTPEQLQTTARKYLDAAHSETVLVLPARREPARPQIGT